MATRVVTGTIYRPDGTPWAEARIHAELSRDAYTRTGAFPAGTINSVSTYTDESGEWQLTLTADLPNAYKFVFPSGGYDYTLLPLGDGTPIALSALQGIFTEPASGLNMTDLITEHEASADPHTAYMTASEVDTSVATALGNYATDAELGLLTAEFEDHQAASDPHPQYLSEAEATVGYASAGHTHTGLTPGPHTHTWNDVTGEPIFALDSELDTVNAMVVSHQANASNPHGTTYAQVGAAALNHTHTGAQLIGVPRVFGLGYLDGVLTAGDDKGPNLRLDANVTLARLGAFVKTAATGAGTTIDVKRSSNNGSSWASVLSTPLALGSGVKFVDVSSFPDATLDAGDFFRLDVLTIPGAGNPPSGLTVQLDVTTR